MITLTNLEICKLISEICDIKTIHEMDIGNDYLHLYIETENDDFEYYRNPLTDDALIFNLAFKHEVKIDYFDECVYMKYPLRKLARHWFDKDNIASSRKAICLAIIEAHKENV